jgi:hypothetical protein
MTLMPSITLSVAIACGARRVYEFAADPTNLPHWATTFFRSVRQDGDEWAVDTPQGPFRLRVAPTNALGVLDHTVIPADGAEVFVPMRVVANGSGSLVLFTLFRRPEMSDGGFAQDLRLVEHDLQTLKRVLEA